MSKPAKFLIILLFSLFLSCPAHAARMAPGSSKGEVPQVQPLQPIDGAVAPNVGQNILAKPAQDDPGPDNEQDGLQVPASSSSSEPEAHAGVVASPEAPPSRLFNYVVALLMLVGAGLVVYAAKSRKQ